MFCGHFLFHFTDALMRSIESFFFFKPPDMLHDVRDSFERNSSSFWYIYCILLKVSLMLMATILIAAFSGGFISVEHILKTNLKCLMHR